MLKRKAEIISGENKNNMQTEQQQSAEATVAAEKEQSRPIAPGELFPSAAASGQSAPLVSPAKRDPARNNSFEELFETVPRPIVELFSPSGDFTPAYKRTRLKRLVHDKLSRELEEQLAEISRTQNGSQLLLTLSNLLGHFGVDSLSPQAKYVLCFYKVPIVRSNICREWLSTCLRTSRARTSRTNSATICSMATPSSTTTSAC